MGTSSWWAASSADVHDSAKLGSGVTVWQLAQVREDAQVGAATSIGRGAYIDANVVLGQSCKVQNNALVYAPADLADGVFVGPAAILTNDTYPRAITPDGERKGAGDWQPVGVTVGYGAAIGAGAIVLGGVVVGSWVTVAAGAVVTKSVPGYAMVAGVPARQVGWVGPAGVPLESEGDVWRCPEEGRRFREEDGSLRELA